MPPGILGRFVRRPAAEQWRLLLAWIMLGFSRALIIAIPFRHIAPALGRCSSELAGVQHVTPPQQVQAQVIGRIIQRAARHTPWDANCFAQAITARVLLGAKRIPHTLHFGVARDESGRLEAHAWVCAGQTYVTGGDACARFTVVRRFVAGPLATPASL